MVSEIQVFNMFNYVDKVPTCHYYGGHIVYLICIIYAKHETISTTHAYIAIHIDSCIYIYTVYIYSKKTQHLTCIPIVLFAIKLCVSGPIVMPLSGK